MPPPWADLPLDGLDAVALDLETTGLHPHHGDRIVSIGAVRVRDGRILRGECVETLVNPGRPIPAESTAIHGIVDADVASAPRAGEAVAELRAFIGQRPIVAHVASFDVAFLTPVVRRADLEPLPPALDTMLLSAVVWPGRDAQHGLDALTGRLGATVRGRHTAVGDAVAAGECLLAMVPLLAERGIRTVDDAVRAANRTRLARHTRGAH